RDRERDKHIGVCVLFGSSQTSAVARAVCEATGGADSPLPCRAWLPGGSWRLAASHPALSLQPQLCRLRNGG
ncbi:MAG: hypothetical protein ACK559_37190, partial [bacterium]